MRNLYTLFFLFLILSAIVQAQMISKWNVIFEGKELAKKFQLNTFEPSNLTVYNQNYFSFLSQPAGYPYLTFSTHIAMFISPKDTNVLKLASKEASFQIKSINYVDSTTIFCLVDSAQFSYTDGINVFRKYISFVYKSTDGGKNWTIYPTQQSSLMRKRPSLFLRMRDLSNGLLVQLPDTLEDYDRILLTKDGWKTYKEVKTNKFFLSENGFYSPPVVAVFTQNKDLWLSSNDGESWDKIQFPFFLQSQRSIYFVNDTFWLFSGYNTLLRSKVLLKSTNSGLKWDTLFVLPSIDTNNLTLLPPFDEIHITTFIGKKYAYTNDFGKTWKFITPYTYHNGNELVVLLAYYDGRLAYGTSSLLEGPFPQTIEKYTGDSTLSPPKFIEPKGYFNIPINFTLKWNKIIGAENYHLQIAEGSGVDFLDPTTPLPSFETDLICDTILTDTTFQLTFSKNYKTYHCRIRAQNQNFISPWFAKYFVTRNEINSVDANYSNNYLIQSKIISKSNISNLSLMLPEKFDIYDVLGKKICQDCTSSEFLILREGIYILKMDNFKFLFMVVE